MPLVVLFQRDVALDEPNDVTHVVAFVAFVHHGEGDAFSPSASRSTNAVHVGLADVGDFEVDDVAYAFDVNAPCGDVGGHKHMNFPFAEGIHGLFALRLAFVAVDGLGSDVVLLEVTNNLVCAVFGAGEHQCRLHLRFVQKLNQQVPLGALTHKHHPLIYRFGGTAHASHFHTNGVGEDGF